MDECPGCSLCCGGCGAEKYGLEPEPHVCGQEGTDARPSTGQARRPALAGEAEA